MSWLWWTRAPLSESLPTTSWATPYPWRWVSRKKSGIRVRLWGIDLTASNGSITDIRISEKTASSISFTHELRSQRLPWVSLARGQMPHAFKDIIFSLILCYHADFKWGKCLPAAMAWQHKEELLLCCRPLCLPTIISWSLSSCSTTCRVGRKACLYKLSVLTHWQLMLSKEKTLA